MSIYLANNFDDETVVAAYSATGGSAAASNDTITLTNSLANGDRIVFTGLLGGVGLNTTTVYYVRDRTSTTFKVATTATGAAVNISTDYSVVNVAKFTAPVGWTEETTVGGAEMQPYWVVDTAPAWHTGKVCKATQNAGDKYLTKAFASAAGNGATVRIVASTTNATSTRAGHYLFYNGTTIAFSILFHTDGKIYVTNMATAAKEIASSYVVNTAYDIQITLGAAGAISSASVNGNVTNAIGTMNNSVTAVNTLRAAAYNGGSGAGTLYFDLVAADDATAAPSISIATTGTLDGTTLGAGLYGDAIIGLAGATANDTRKIEREADASGSWADITSYSGVTWTAGASGVILRDKRPNYGSQPVGNSHDAKYRVTVFNSHGSQAAVTSSTLEVSVDTSAIKTFRADLLHDIMAGSYVASDSTHGLSGEKYPSNWVMAMAYAYYATGVGAYKTDAETEFDYIVNTVINADGLAIVPDDNAVVYRDYHMRIIYYCAVAVRIMRLAGDDVTAAAWMTEIDKWGKAFFDQLNGGDPAPTTATKYGWDPSNTRTGTQNAAWAANTAYSVGAIVKPVVANSRTYRCVTGGTSHATTEPVWTTTAGATQPTDGTVVWECIGATGDITHATYTNNGTTYPGTAGTDVMDVNQLSEEAACWALLTTDPDSDFYSAGAYQTKAETRITEIMGLLQTYQVSRGAIPIGESLSGIPYNGNQQYDTVYGGFTVTTAAVVYSQRPDLCHARTLTWIDRVLDWLDTSYDETEPLATQHYDDSTAIGLPEVEFGDAGYQIRARTNPREGLWNTGCLIDVETGKWRWYAQAGNVTNSPTIGDPVQCRLFNGLAIAESVLLQPPSAAGGLLLLGVG